MTETSEQLQKILQTLKGVDFFSKLSMGEAEELMRSLKKITCGKGHAVIKQKAPGDAFYMISKGRVSIWKKKGFFSRELLAYLGPDQFFGEMALVTNEPRSATIIAEEPCEFLVLYKEDFTKILMHNPAIAQSIQGVLAERKAKNIAKK